MILRTFTPSVVRLITGMRTTRNEEQPHPAHPHIYYSNHSSNLDFLLIWSSLPKATRLTTRPIAAADYWGSNALRSHLAKRVFQALLIERKRVTRCSSPLGPMKEILQKGESLIIFPEGTRDAGTQVSLFKSGLYHLAKQVPETQFIPVWLENAFRILPKGEILPLPLLSTVTFGQPTQITNTEDKATFLTRMRQQLLETRPL